MQWDPGRCAEAGPISVFTQSAAPRAWVQTHTVSHSSGPLSVQTTNHALLPSDPNLGRYRNSADHVGVSEWPAPLPLSHLIRGAVTVFCCRKGRSQCDSSCSCRLCMCLRWHHRGTRVMCYDRSSNVTTLCLGGIGATGTGNGPQVVDGNPAPHPMPPAPTDLVAMSV